MSKTITLCSKEKSYFNVLWPARMTMAMLRGELAMECLKGRPLCHHALDHCKLVAPGLSKLVVIPLQMRSEDGMQKKQFSPVVTQSSP